MSDLQAQLKDIQTRQKALTGRRDQLIRDAAVAERNLETSYEKLRELGVENPEKLTAKELRAQASKVQEELVAKVEELLAELEKGEALVAQYQNL